MNAMSKMKRMLAVILSVAVLSSGCSSKQQDVKQKDTLDTAEKVEEVSNDVAEQQDSDSVDITLSFAGDINFDDTWVNMLYYHENGDDITKCIDPDYIAAMNAADVMWINNEFTYSTNGSPLSGKAYTFRANPENVSILHELGVDIVGLANNHVYDYGKDALLDTFTTLENANVLYVGAGRDLSEAMKPVYVEEDGITIAYVAASRAEKNKMTPQATETEPGILRCYDTSLFIEEIKEADANADIVIALPHWGTEYSTVLEDAQTSTGKEYIDAGADVVIGAHTHCLQGMEFYNGKPIFYSLGNYWFNEKTLDTMLLTLHVTGDTSEQTIEASILPGTQKGCVTTMAETADDKTRIFDYLESISVNAKIDDRGVVTEDLNMEK